MRLLSLILLLIVVQVQATTGSLAYNKQIFYDFEHYAKYSALAACITRDEIKEGWFVEGACELDFCRNNEQNSKSAVIKIAKAKPDENGTGFIAIDLLRKEIILSFRGSTTSADWLNDFKLLAVDYLTYNFNESTGLRRCPKCMVHYGFYKNIPQVAANFFGTVDALVKQHAGYQIVVTGHSLGAAIATLVGIELRVKGYRPKVLVYAAPQLFNGRAVQWVDEIFETSRLDKRIKEGQDFDWGYVRVVHRDDYVPALPPTFHNAGTEFYIDKADLPHEYKDVRYVGVTGQLASSSSLGLRKTLLQLLHATQHRSYFITINYCGNF